jgi:hypothetical protein
MKVSFPTLEDLLRESKDPVRVIIIRKGRSAKSGKLDIPLTSFLVVVTAKLADGNEVGEYVYQVGEDFSYFRDKMVELGNRSIEIETTIKKQIESAGHKLLPGRYVPDDAAPVLGAAP